MIFIPILLLVGGATAIAVILATADDPPVHEPDLPPGTPPLPIGLPSSHYKLVDAIMPELQKAAAASGIPLGVLVGWIAKESGGRLNEVTRLDERGYFQLMPDESKSLGLDHERLSTDPVYSINAGLLLIGRYMKEADALGIAPHGSSYFWKVTKLGHTMGSGDTKTLARAAQAAGHAGSWGDFENYALSGAVHTKHSPQKWLPFIDQIFQVGAPFGTGGDSGMTVAGAGGGYSDIPDVLDLLPKYRRG